MHIISRKRLNDFCIQHVDAAGPLERWYRLAKRAQFDDFVSVRAVFPDADYVHGRVVFDIGGNKFRLVAVIHYNRKRIYVRAIMTHAEYSKWRF